MYFTALRSYAVKIKGPVTNSLYTHLLHTNFLKYIPTYIASFWVKLNLTSSGFLNHMSRFSSKKTSLPSFSHPKTRYFSPRHKGGEFCSKFSKKNFPHKRDPAILRMDGHIGRFFKWQTVREVPYLSTRQLALFCLYQFLPRPTAPCNAVGKGYFFLFFVNKWGFLRNPENWKK